MLKQCLRKLSTWFRSVQAQFRALSKFLLPLPSGRKAPEKSCSINPGETHGELLSTAAMRAKLGQERWAVQSKKIGSEGLVIPKLNHWVIQEHQQNIYILGTVENHPSYPSKSRIQTSRIMSYQQIDGRHLVSTCNSIYELGEPLIQLQDTQGDAYQNLRQQMSDRRSSVWTPQQIDLSEITGLAIKKTQSA